MFKIVLSIILLSIVIHAQSLAKTYIPVNAYKYMNTVYEESDKVLPEFEQPYYFSSLIEQESCVRLKGNGYWARRCWSPISELKTDREQGIGLGQITRAWKKDGRLRFDTLNSLRKKYPKELHELTWENIKERPDLQITAIMLLWKDNFLYYSNNLSLETRIALADSAYNGGRKYLNRERSTCKLREDCNSSIWFNNIENTKSARAKRKLYGNRSAWDINREHVKTTMKVRLNKYKDNYYKNIQVCYDNNGTRCYVMKKIKQ